MEINFFLTNFTLLLGFVLVFMPFLTLSQWRNCTVKTQYLNLSWKSNFLILKHKSLTCYLKNYVVLLSTHMVVNKGFLPTTAACPQYPQRFVWRMLACLRVFIGIASATSWGEIASHKVALLQGWGNDMKLSAWCTELVWDDIWWQLMNYCI